MKKYKLLLVISILLLPLSVFARTATKEDLIEVIDSFENIQVDDNVMILSMDVQKENIEITLLENDLPEIRYVPYQFHDNTLTFKGGEIEKDTLEVNNNKYAFYLYLILESKSTASYEESNYYNETCLQNKVKELTEDKGIYQNTGKTFGAVLEKTENNKYQIHYEYYLDGDDIIPPLRQPTIDGELRNPETGNFSTFVTITLFLVIGLGAYTVWGSDKKKSLGSR